MMRRAPPPLKLRTEPVSACRTHRVLAVLCPVLVRAITFSSSSDDGKLHPLFFAPCQVGTELSIDMLAVGSHSTLENKQPVKLASVIARFLKPARERERETDCPTRLGPLGLAHVLIRRARVQVTYYCTTRRTGTVLRDPAWRDSPGFDSCNESWSPPSSSVSKLMRHWSLVGPIEAGVAFLCNSRDAPTVFPVRSFD